MKEKEKDCSRKRGRASKHLETGHTSDNIPCFFQRLGFQHSQQSIWRHSACIVFHAQPLPLPPPTLHHLDRLLHAWILMKNILFTLPMMMNLELTTRRRNVATDNWFAFRYCWCIIEFASKTKPGNERCYQVTPYLSSTR